MVESGDMKYSLHATTVIMVVAIITNGYLWMQLSTLDAQHAELNAALDKNLDNSLQERASTTEAIKVRNAKIAKLTDILDETSEELDETEDKLKDEKDRNDEFEDRINTIASTVSDLDKLSKTDEELLQKYSKVYFLNEHYIPESIQNIDNKWKYTESRVHQLHSKVMPFFEEMVEEALEDDINLWVVSSFRSFETQAQLKGAYSITYGSGANTFSADQGYSEHQLGTTIDFTTDGISGSLTGFENTPAYEWLVDNAHKYGFVLSYPEKNGYYVFEPWHWRFVGEDLARDLRKDNAYFYDWDQRDIDEYLLTIFD